MFYITDTQLPIDVVSVFTSQQYHYIIVQIESCSSFHACAIMGDYVFLKAYNGQITGIQNARPLLKWLHRNLEDPTSLSISTYNYRFLLKLCVELL